jgi:hypothetical protein
MRKFSPLAVLAAIALAACNNNPADSGDDMDDAMSPDSGSSGGSDDMTTQTSSSGGESGDDFVQACLYATNNTSNMCECLSERADEDLTDGAREFLIATMNDENERVMAMRGELSIEEMSTAGMFLVGASTQCAREGRHQ